MQLMRKRNVHSEYVGPIRRVIEEIGEALPILIYVALKPLYLWKSGTLQICDILFILMTVKILLTKVNIVKGNQYSYKVNLAFELTLLYQIIVNIIWSGITGDWRMNYRSLYYMYNFHAFFCTIYIGTNVGSDRLGKAIALGGYYSAIVAAIGMIVSTSAGTRSSGFFNNPNQLGYYAVMLFAIAIKGKRQLSFYKFAFMFAVSTWAVIVSLSKAAELAYIVAVIIYIVFLQEDRSKLRIIKQMVLLGVFCYIVYTVMYSNSQYVTSNTTLMSMRTRIMDIAKENDSNLADGRGYGRLSEMGHNIIWGTGEGAYSRFVHRSGSEVHSTFVSLWVCYGLIGLLSYLAIFKACMGKSKRFLINLCILSGPLLYSITHNGIRNTLLWIFLAAMLTETAEVDTKNQKTANNSSGYRVGKEFDMELI